MTNRDLDAVSTEIWRKLAAGQGAWRAPVLANVTPAGMADARIVVLRHVFEETREVIFFTDRRSRKFAGLTVNPSSCFVIYDVDAHWQLRLYGEAVEEAGGPRLDTWWSALGEHQRMHYAAGENEGQTQESGRENFVAFRVEIVRFHCLWLHAEGNEAAEFEWRDAGWRGRFVRP